MACCFNMRESCLRPATRGVNGQDISFIRAELLSCKYTNVPGGAKCGWVAEGCSTDLRCRGRWSAGVPAMAVDVSRGSGGVVRVRVHHNMQPGQPRGCRAVAS